MRDLFHQIHSVAALSSSVEFIPTIGAVCLTEPAFKIHCRWRDRFFCDRSCVHVILTIVYQGGDSNGGELAELTSTEISLDLQGLIDDANFNDDNLFGDLGDAKRNELNNVNQQIYGHHNNGARTSPNGSLGSSGHSSPTGGPEAATAGAPPPPPVPGSNPAAAGPGQPPVGYHPNYRNALPYLPGSVHHTGYGGRADTAASSSTNVQVKQEPGENHHAHHHNLHRSSQFFHLKYPLNFYAWGCYAF